MSLFQTQDVFSGDRVWYLSHTLGAHALATVVGPSPNGPQFCHMRCLCPGGVTQVDHESAQLSRLEAVVVASPKSLHLCSVCLHQWRVPQLALKYPCNLPAALGGRPSRRGVVDAMGAEGCRLKVSSGTATPTNYCPPPPVQPPFPFQEAMWPNWHAPPNLWLPPPIGPGMAW